jgi:hypothetical protein
LQYHAQDRCAADFLERPTDSDPPMPQCHDYDDVKLPGKFDVLWWVIAAWDLSLKKR